jgi:hypothetical protein
MPEKVKELEGLYGAWDAQMAKPRWGRQPGARPAQRPPANLRRGGSAEQQFKALDLNKDGKLTPDEVGRPRQFQQADRNRDGVVTLGELRAFLKGRGVGGP